MLLSVGCLRTDVSGNLSVPSSRVRPLTMRLTGCPKTSVLNQPTLRNNPEDERIQVTSAAAYRLQYPLVNGRT